MYMHPPFVPNYPPPPLSTREAIIHEGLRALEQSTADQQWLSAWLARKHQSRPANPFILSDYRQKLLQHAHLLRRYEQALHDDGGGEPLRLELRRQIDQSGAFIYEPDRVARVQKQIQRRRLKRARLRRQKDQRHADAPTAPVGAPQTIDKPVDERIREISGLLETIGKLEQLKRDHQQPNDRTMRELTDIRDACAAKLQEYQRERESDQSRCSNIALYNSLFNNHDRSFYESVNPDAQDILRAHRHVNDLVEIRQAWDRYAARRLSSAESTLPRQWHEPSPPSDAQWAVYLATNPRS